MNPSSARQTMPLPVAPAAGVPSLQLVENPARLATLAAYQILDTPPEQGFDDVVTLACQLCAVPVALVSLVDKDRQWFKAAKGVEVCETSLEQSVCVHVLTESDLLVIPDLTQDPRTLANPLVTGAPRIRFYAGVPLRTETGQTLGSLCVIDTRPRLQGLTGAQAGALRALGRQVMTQLELRRALASRDTALGHLHAHEENRQLLNRELSHRLKNTLALVQSIASQTLRNAEDMPTAREALTARLGALGRAHEMLLNEKTDTTTMRALVKGALALHADRESRLKISGPDFRIGRAAALSLALMLHELATNATKYGALSVAGGHVHVDWVIEGKAGQEQFRLAWTEHDGPPVTSPTRQGFGSKLIARGLAGHVAGAVRQEYPPRGMVCTLSVPLADFKVGD